MTSEQTSPTQLPAMLEPYQDILRPHLRRTVGLRLRPVPVDDPQTTLSQAQANPAGSRIGGPALVTAEHPWPVDDTNKPMLHMAQLNLTELPAREHYPTSGLLQFFHADDECYGLDSTNGTCVRYIPAAMLAGGTLQGDLTTQSDAITGGYFEVTGELFDQYPTADDFEYETLITPLFDAADLDEDDLYDAFTDAQTFDSIYGNGWASFTQFDPREHGESPLCDYQLLLQLGSTWEDDSPVEIMFGDAGICTYFIHPRDLAALNFNNVEYSWDCC